jgi:hypothetical protein
MRKYMHEPHIYSQKWHIIWLLWIHSQLEKFPADDTTTGTPLFCGEAGVTACRMNAIPDANDSDMVQDEPIEGSWKKRRQQRWQPVENVATQRSSTASSSRDNPWFRHDDPWNEEPVRRPSKRGREWENDSDRFWNWTTQSWDDWSRDDADDHWSSDREWKTPAWRLTRRWSPTTPCDWDSQSWSNRSNRW